MPNFSDYVNQNNSNSSSQAKAMEMLKGWASKYEGMKEEDLIKVYLKNKDVSITQILDCFKIDNELEKKQELILDIIK